MKGTLYLVPVTLGTSEFRHVIPEMVIATTMKLRNFIVEDIRSARRFLRLIDPLFPIDDSDFLILNEHTSESDIPELLSWLDNGLDTGLMSEAGLPGIADPGSPVVLSAHRKGIKVVPLTGPSSIILALVSSGLNGQNFNFNGYLPIKSNERNSSIKRYEQAAINGTSQIFIEAPYRNQKLLADILENCSDTTLLSVAVDITSNNEYIKTLTIKEWKKSIPQINKRPAIFIIGAVKP